MFTQQHWERAARFLAGNVRQHLFNPQIRPHWLGDGDQFWYQHESPDGPRIMLVDAATGTQSAAPDDFRPAPAPTRPRLRGGGRRGAVPLRRRDRRRYRAVIVAAPRRATAPRQNPAAPARRPRPDSR